MCNVDKKTPEISQQAKKKKPFTSFGKKPVGGKTELPVLKYGKGNNFHRFRLALTKVAIKEYGNLGKLIELEKYCVPKLVLTDYTAMGEHHIKELAREVGKMESDHPRLYGLIRQHMSMESRDKVAQE
jgi:hypothetical protein